MGYTENIMKNANTNTQKQDKQEVAPKANQIKLGIDIHADSYRVVGQLE